ncbi:MAG: hypothetical protein HPY71_13205 [Firmicutes bacterium]|nr:hypothetical protein [Bacillota bacterium]
MHRFDEVQFEQAKAVHSRATVVVSHDHMMNLDSFKQMREGGVTAKILHMLVDALPWAKTKEEYQYSISEFEGWTKRALVAIDQVRSLVANSPDVACLALTVEDIREAKVEGKAAVLMGFEGGKPLEGSLEVLRCLYQLGVRHMQLTWAFNNQIAGTQDDPENTGLTPFGHQVVREMNRLGMVIDLSHLSRKAMQDVYEITEDPVINSHAGSRVLAESTANLSDAALKQLAENGGVVGVHFCAHLIKTGARRASIDDLLDQVAYIADLVGIDHVGLGPDYFDYNEDFRRNTMHFYEDAYQNNDFDLSWVEGLEDYSKFPALTGRMLQRGFSEEDIIKVLGGNLLRVFRKVFGR